MEEQQQREKHEQIIIQQYKDLFERSNKYFAGLRELPQHGPKRLWQPYFQKTFDTYTQLWKYQLDHRQVLDKKYGLKRFEIGDIAAKIAQLYYHYYLRTSDTRYLQESFVFYDAVRVRKYFEDIRRENAALYNKKLRYYARFIVVCLLQNKRSIVEDLLRELRENINSQNLPSSLQSHADNEWQLVVSELESFIRADTIVNIGSNMDNLSYRYRPLHSHTPQYDNPIFLSEAILIGHRKRQVKFSELTLDMFRMMQAIEYNNSTTLESRKQGSTTPRVKNPHKSVLYRPGYSDVLLSLSGALSELEYSDNATLLYISADGCKDGLTLNPKRRSPSSYPSPSISPTSATSSPTRTYQFGNYSDPSCLTLDDILPFTRKPFFMIVDSDNSGCMLPKHMQSRFGLPFVCLMSPRINFPQLQNPLKTGSIFTYFLTSPLAALALSYGFNKIENSTSDLLSEYLGQQYGKLLDMLFANDQLDTSLKVFLDNEILQRFLLNYLLCRVTMNRYFTEHMNEEPANTLPDYLPSAFPELPGIEDSTSSEYEFLADTVDHILKLYLYLLRGVSNKQLFPLELTRRMLRTQIRTQFRNKTASQQEQQIMLQRALNTLQYLYNT